MVRVLVCGGRDFDDQTHLYTQLDNLHLSGDGPITEIIQGAASGADTIAAQWAKDEGIKCLSFPAKWDDFSHPKTRMRVS